MQLNSRIFTALMATTLVASGASGHEDARPTELFSPGAAHSADAAQSRDTLPIRIDGLGDYGWNISQTSHAAQDWFNQGLGHLWGFNHAEAVRAFRAAQAEDPTCAMCYWGEAYALGPNLNDGMHPENEAAAVEAARMAAVHARTPRDSVLAQAIGARYAADLDQSARNQAFADVMLVLAERFPEDANILSLRADALMNLQPWDYWEADGITPRGATSEILSTLERAMEVSSTHPAALHLYIHAVEASADPARGLEAADRLRGLAPSAGHLVHMPAHIYNRTGRFAESIAVNRAALAADAAYLARAGDHASPLYRYGYYPHNAHFLLVAAQMSGSREDAIDAADHLAEITSDEVSAELAWVQAILTAPLTAHAQFSDADTILDLPRPDAAFPFVVGHWHYARGVALARIGDAQAALIEQQAIDRLIADADMSGLKAQYLPARDVLSIASHVLEARIAQAVGDYDEAVHHLHEAIVIEDTIAYMEPSYWYYPVRQTLGAVELQRGKAGAAVNAFEAALDQTPNNAWARWGLWQAWEDAAVDQGDAGEIIRARAAFERAWLGDADLLSLDRL